MSVYMLPAFAPNTPSGRAALEGVQRHVEQTFEACGDRGIRFGTIQTAASSAAHQHVPEESSLIDPEGGFQFIRKACRCGKLFGDRANQG